jgi:hypothetical protein
MLENKILKKIKSLNPEKDYWEIVQLSIWYEFPWDYNRALELALYKTFAVPSISKILFQSKEFEHHTQKRYDDTDILLSNIIDYGLNHRKGQEALQRINWIHSNYKISNEDYLYVLATFVFDTGNWINKYGYRKLTANEEIAGFKVWQEIGKQMNIKNIPDTIEELEIYYNNYEKEHFIYNKTNEAIAQVTEDLMLSWYLPKYMFDFARPILHSVMQPHLLKAFHFSEPHQLLRLLVTVALKMRSIVASLNPIQKPFYRSTMSKYRYYENGYEIKDLGPNKLKKNCPYHAVQEKLAHLKT